MTHDCPECGRRFGGTTAYDRHLDRRRDRCKSTGELRRLGIEPNDAGVFVRAPINTQTTLLDKRLLERKEGSSQSYADLQERRAMLIQEAGGACIDCGFRGDPACFDFHHRPGTTKRFQLYTTNLRKPWVEIRRELAKCDLLCSNCHRVRHLTRRGKTETPAESSSLREAEDTESRAPGRCGAHCRDATTLACQCSCGGRYHGAGRRAGELEARDRGQISLGAAS